MQDGEKGARVANMEVGRPENNSANLKNISRAQAADLVNVSERTVRIAKLVEDFPP